MKKLDLDIDIEITDDRQVDVTVNYRCWLSPTHALYPMDVLGSIYKGHSLSDFKKRHLKSYKKDYERVEVVDVFVDMDALPINWAER